MSSNRTVNPKTKLSVRIFGAMLIFILPAAIVTYLVLSDLNTPGNVTRYDYKIVNTYPHDPHAFTQGLVWEDGYLYEGTGLNELSSLRKVDLKTGEVLQQYNLPDIYFGEGITIFGNNIIQLTYQSNVGFVYDRDSFELRHKFSYTTEGWGLTHNGKELIMSDGTDNIYFLDAQTYDTISRIKVTNNGKSVWRINELEYIDGQIYANIWQTDTIVIISPKTGNVTGQINLAGLLSRQQRQEDVDVLNGIAYDPAGKRLFVTGKFWPALFEIELIPKK